MRIPERGTLRRAQPPREAQGFTVFLTGLSGSGKSTIASALRARLTETTGRPVTLLDGDLVRRHLSSELGFSRKHRDLNVLRVGWVASEIVRHGGVVICALIAPYDEVRRQVREMIEPVGGFLLVHVATPIDTCEARDRKGLYARARAGLLPNFTGVSDPYEPPADAALVIDTRDTSVTEACALIVARLTSDGYLVHR
jgi:sulfate adenylyltransferase